MSTTEIVIEFDYLAIIDLAEPNPVPRRRTRFRGAEPGSFLAAKLHGDDSRAAGPSGRCDIAPPD